MMGHSNIPLCCDVSADGLSFLTCHKGFDGTGCELRVWDRRCEFATFDRPFFTDCLRISDGQMLQMDRQGVTRSVLRGHEQAVQSCAFLPGGASGDLYAVSGGSDKTLRMWDCSGNGGEEQAPPSACLGTHYFPSPVQTIALLTPNPAAPAAAASGGDGFDLNFEDDEPLAPPAGAGGTAGEIAVGCFDGSLVSWQDTDPPTP